MIQNSLPTTTGVSTHEKYMSRCLELARLGAGNVAPNPMVGAMLVYNDRIIGEGYHQKYGEEHAEPNCIASVMTKDRNLIADSAMYVSLEPCVHYGKTPPCADLIIKNKVPKIVLGCRDPFKEINGKGIEKLKAAGIEVVQGVLEKECEDLNKRFLTFHIQHRPYIILKWAQTANGIMGFTGNERFYISNEFTKRLVHKWRGQEAAILVGTNTALMDNPELTTRFWTGNNPVRLVVDLDLKLPGSLKIFNGAAKTIVFNKLKDEEKNNLRLYRVTEDVNLVHQVTNALYKLKLQSLIVEGGARLLQSFIDAELWDEARIITNEELTINNGLHSPKLAFCSKTEEKKIFGDRVEIFKSRNNPYN